MKNLFVSLLLFGGLAICGCGGSNSGVVEIPLSNETGYTPEQETEMKTRKYVDDGTANFELGSGE